MSTKMMVVVAVALILVMENVSACRRNSQCSSGLFLFCAFFFDRLTLSYTGLSSLGDLIFIYFLLLSPCRDYYFCSFSFIFHFYFIFFHFFCPSGWCEGGGFFSSGHCISKRHDGHHCYNGDGNSCWSGQCTCGLCGRKQKGGAACATNDNCKSNWCERGSWSWGCSGKWVGYIGP